MTQENFTNLAWFAVQVKVGRESAVSEALMLKGYELCSPTYTPESTVKARSAKSTSGPRVASRPLFPGYIFCRFAVERRLPILITPGVMKVVGYGKVPVAIADADIHVIQAALRERLPMQPHPYAIGHRVRISEGPLRSLEGIVAAVNGFKSLVVNIPLLQRSVAVRISPERIESVAVPVSGSEAPAVDVCVVSRNGVISMRQSEVGVL